MDQAEFEEHQINLGAKDLVHCVVDQAEFYEEHNNEIDFITNNIVHAGIENLTEKESPNVFKKS